MKMSGTAPLLLNDEEDLYVGIKHPNGTESIIAWQGEGDGGSGSGTTPYTPVYVNASGTVADGAGLIVVDASAVAIDLVLGAPPSPNAPVYVVISGWGHQVKVNGIPLGNSTSGDEAIGLIHDGSKWYIFTKYGW